MNTIYVSDLDGTLLRDDATLSAFSRNVLRELLRNDIPFTVASARNVTSIRAILAGLKLHLPVIEFIMKGFPLTSTTIRSAFWRTLTCPLRGRPSAKMAPARMNRFRRSPVGRRLSPGRSSSSRATLWRPDQRVAAGIGNRETEIVAHGKSYRRFATGTLRLNVE